MKKPLSMPEKFACTAAAAYVSILYCSALIPFVLSWLGVDFSLMFFLWMAKNTPRNGDFR